MRILMSMDIELTWVYKECIGEKSAQHKEQEQSHCFIVLLDLHHRLLEVAARQQKFRFLEKLSQLIPCLTIFQRLYQVDRLKPT